MRSNCILFAFGLLFRRKGRKRGIVIRKSRMGGKWPHFIYVEQRRYGWREIHFTPTDKTPRYVYPPVFDGSSHWGDL